MNLHWKKCLAKLNMAKPATKVALFNTVVLLSFYQVYCGDTLSLHVIPNEARRQGLDQRTPCPGDMVEYTCTLTNSSAIALRWTINGTVALYTFLIPDDIGLTQTQISGATSTLINQTTSTLLVNLAEISIIDNGTEIGCTDIGATYHQSRALIIMGPASAPTVTVHPEGLSTLTIDMISPVYGRECVDLYRVTATVGGMTLPTSEQPVDDPTQTMYSFAFPGVDLCRDMLTSVTAVAVTDGMEGTMAASITMDNINRSRTTINHYVACFIYIITSILSLIRTSSCAFFSLVVTGIITSPVSASQIFSSSGIRIILSWQVVDHDIADRFIVVCQSENDAVPFPCLVNNFNITGGTILLPYENNLLGKDIVFRISYSYAFCRSDAVVTTTVQNVNSSLPLSIRNLRAVRVDFKETLFSADSVGVIFSSNCTPSVTVNYNNPLLVTIPDTGLNTGQCQYNIQLVDGNTQQIGYPIIGFFEAECLAPTYSDSNTIIGVSEAVGMTFSITFIFTLFVGIIIGSYSTHYIKTKKSNQQKQPCAMSEANDHQLYDEVIQTKTSAERFKMGENVAYGPVNI